MASEEDIHEVVGGALSVLREEGIDVTDAFTSLRDIGTPADAIAYIEGIAFALDRTPLELLDDLGFDVYSDD